MIYKIIWYSKGCKYLDFDTEIVNVMSLFVILYADDTVILSDNMSNLQKALVHLEEYCNNW